MFWVVANPALPGSELRQSCDNATMLVPLEKLVIVGKGRQAKDRQSHLRFLNGIWHVQLKDHEVKPSLVALSVVSPECRQQLLEQSQRHLGIECHCLRGTT